MYYRLKRQNQPDKWDFTGWAISSDGIITEASSGLVAFINRPVTELMTWCEERKVRWHVTEKRT